MSDKIKKTSVFGLLSETQLLRPISVLIVFKVPEMGHELLGQFGNYKSAVNKHRAYPPRPTHLKYPLRVQEQF